MTKPIWTCWEVLGMLGLGMLIGIPLGICLMEIMH